jgi:hypothetical protein
MQKLLTMEERLAQRVIGQDEALEAVANAVRRARAGFRIQIAHSVHSSFLDQRASAKPKPRARSLSFCLTTSAR